MVVLGTSVIIASIILLESCTDDVSKAMLLLIGCAVFKRASSLHAAIRVAHIGRIFESSDLKLELVVAFLKNHVCFLDITILDLNLLEDCSSIIVLAELIALKQWPI